MAIAIVIAAAAVRWLFLGALGTRAPYMTFYPAVMIATLLCGFPAGILATFLSALIAAYLWIAPVFNLDIKDPVDLLGLIVFILSCSIVAGLSAILRRDEIRGIETEAQIKLLMERKQMEELLLQSEERYRSVVEDQTELICRFKADGTIIFVNEVYCHFFGKKKNELLGSKWHPSAFTDDVPDVEEQLRTLTPSNPVVVIENRVYAGSGDVRWMQFVNRGHFDTEDRLTEIQSVGRDITERKEAERALRKSEERLNLALSSSKMGVWDWDLRSNTVFWSPECYDIVGLKEFNGAFEAFAVLLHPDDAAHVMDTVDKALKQRSSYADEFRIIRPDGEERWLSNLGQATYDKDGVALSLLGTVQDITARRNIVISLYEHNELLQAIINGTNDLIYVKDRDSRIIIANPAYLSFIGKLPEEVVGKNALEIFPDHDQARTLLENDQRIMESGTAETVEEIVQVSAERRYFMSYKIPRHDVNGQIVGLIGISHDITERKQAESDLRSYSRRLIEIGEDLRKRLAAELHDEVGRDLTVLGMNLALISNELPEAPKDLAAMIQDSKKLTEGISRTTREIMAGLRPPVLDDFGLSAALRWHADVFSKRTGMVVSVQADDLFPRLNTEKEMALFRIAQEALMNAAKHAKTQAVTIILRKTDHMIWFAIEDEGVGFELAPPFHTQDGSGWGMKIMQERAELIGGTFHAVSTPGKGTVVSVYLPLEDV